MANNVSLLPNQAKFRLDQIRLAQRGKKIALAVAGVVGVVFAVVYMAYFINKGLLARSEKNLAQAQADFKSLGKEVALNQEARYRLKLVSEILSSRFDYGSAMKKALDFLPKEMEMSGFDFEDRDVLGIDGCLGSYQLMDEFEKKVENVSTTGLDEGAEVKSARFSNLEVSEDGWCFKLEVGV